MSILSMSIAVATNIYIYGALNDSDDCNVVGHDEQISELIK